MLSPVVMGLLVADQLKEAFILLSSEKLSGTPLQVVRVLPLIIAGCGNTVIVKFCGADAQLPADPVTV